MWLFQALLFFSIRLCDYLEVVELNIKQICSFKKLVSSRNKTCNGEEVDDIILAVTENPKTSVRCIQQTTGIVKSLARFIVQKQHSHPFKYRFCYRLRSGEDERRRSFCGGTPENVRT